MNVICLKSLLLSLQMAFGQDADISKVMPDASPIGKMYTCPRCRRARPPGPRKRATPPKWSKK